MWIYNSAHRRKEEFKPLQEGKVGIYACGPTVYNYFHIGNARPFITFDVLRRQLEREGYDVLRAYDGLEALDYATTRDIHLIIIDVMMPKLDGLVLRMEKKAEKNRAAVEKYAFWGLVILVAIPLPGTGAWTGALVAAMMEIRLKRAFPAIAIGVAIAGVIVSVITYGAQAIF